MSEHLDDCDELELGEPAEQRRALLERCAVALREEGYTLLPELIERELARTAPR